MKIAQTKNQSAETGKRSASSSLNKNDANQTETLAAPAWRLPGGVRLADYALRGGFVATSLLTRTARDR